MRLARSPRPGALALVHPGRADGWWHLGANRFAWHDGDHLFVETGDEVLVVPAEGPLHLVPADPGCLVTTPGAELRIGPTVERFHPREARLGAVDAHRERFEWEAAGLDLPLGARRSSTLRPFPTGRGAVWTANGWLYRHTDGAAALAAAPRHFLVGPGGALVTGDDAFTSGGAPGCPLAPLPCPLSDPIRFDPGGMRVEGIGPDGEGVAIDLVANRIIERRDAAPVGGGWLHPDGTLEVGGRVLRTGIREASWALSGSRLAGPGGRVWDLRKGEVLGDGEVALGATVATTTGFVTVHWETGAGSHLDFDGRVLGRFQIPLDEDDVVIDGRAEGDTAVFGTALGTGWRVQGHSVEATVAPEVERAEPPDDWELPVEGEAAVDGVRWGWTTDGLLLARGI